MVLLCSEGSRTRQERAHPRQEHELSEVPVLVGLAPLLQSRDRREVQADPRQAHMECKCHRASESFCIDFLPEISNDLLFIRTERMASR